MLEPDNTLNDVPIAGVRLDHRPASLTESVYNTIRQAIIDATLPPATRVTEAALAKQLDVSKTPVREALLRLREVGLIESDGPRAGRVVTASPEQLRNAYEIRCGLEMTSARLAAQRAGRGLLLEIRDQAKVTVVAADAHKVTAYREADDLFHSLVGQASGNPKLAQMIGDINALVSALRMRSLPDIDASPVCAAHHVSIANALIAGEASAAESLMREHVSYVGEKVLGAFSTAD